jgi:hypothetical protein
VLLLNVLTAVPSTTHVAAKATSLVTTPVKATCSFHWIRNYFS